VPIPIRYVDIEFEEGFRADLLVCWALNSYT
jgi:hypothetical protein